MAIAFDEIAYDIYKPGTQLEVAPRYDRKGLVEYPARGLLVVQQLASGTAIPGQKYQITRPEQGTVLFGAGSIGEAMVKAWKRTNRTTPLYAVGMLDAASATASTSTLTITGTATAGGVIALYIDDQRIPVTITAGMTAAQAATAAAAAVTGYSVPLIVTATAATTVVTFTSKHKGECGNFIPIAHSRREGDAVPAGLTLALTAMSGGATNPTIQTVYDAYNAEWFTDWVAPWVDATNLTATAAEMAERYIASARRDAHFYTASAGTFAALTTLAGLSNSPFITILGLNGSNSAPWRIAAAAAGLAAFQLANDPARQLRGLTLAGISAPLAPSRFLDDEWELLLRAGITSLISNDDGTVAIDRMVTTYKTNSAGVPDRRTYLDVMIPKTMSRIRYDWRVYVSLLYPRHKLADDGSRAAANADAVVTPGRLLATWGGRCTLYEDRGWIEGSSGSGGTTAMAVFERDGDDRNRVNSRQPVTIIGNMMVLAGRLEFFA
ncbi:phage tail sheath subtilisin-like domain-containing protein [Segnochrobactrum spirostomi]|uniref:Phage tail protein n=1 Tax=Segnochrobactrum spirostomi TaxID=2608987 RepID=A0A6A7Y8T2_9HYPH|nr:phage tail sheath subtilisin-like domain-containing protein [Segnochrobactrum spirostomi]MQT14388.1 phage tail protein [Segnochrobactrum spirostomi]